MADGVDVELLTRRDCGLCARAAALLETLAPELSLRVRAVDIDEDASLLAVYTWRVPVVRAFGRDLCEGIVTEADLRAALAPALGGAA